MLHRINIAGGSSMVFDQIGVHRLYRTRSGEICFVMKITEDAFVRFISSEPQMRGEIEEVPGRLFAASVIEEVVCLSSRH